MAARLSPTYRTSPYWWDGVVLPVPPAVGQLPREADVVIVGAGYTGMAAALELAGNGSSVIVLDRERAGWGASTRNGGMVHPGLKHDVHELVATPGGRALYDVTVDAFDGLEKLVADLGVECGWQRSGHLYLAHRPGRVAALEADARTYRDVLGQQARFVPRDELAAEIGSEAYFGGLVVEKSGGLHPARFYVGLADAALDAGAIVVERTEATAVRHGVVHTTRGTIRCRDVLVATNGYTVTAPVGWLRRRILPIGSYIIATEEITPDLARSVNPHGRMFFDTKNFLYYWRLSPDGRRVLFGGRTSFAPTTAERARDSLYDAMIRVHPQLADVAIDRAWGGNVALTVDRYPHLGRHDGVTYAMGYCGTGVALATHFGRVAGRWLAGVGEPGPFVDRRWRAVPPPARVDWLLPVGGWWYQLQDRRG